jgi:hypothetical protein
VHVQAFMQRFLILYIGVQKDLTDSVFIKRTQNYVKNKQILSFLSNLVSRSPHYGGSYQCLGGEAWGNYTLEVHQLSTAQCRYKSVRGRFLFYFINFGPTICPIWEHGQCKFQRILVKIIGYKFLKITVILL